jgi:hypothetical protein
MRAARLYSFEKPLKEKARAAPTTKRKNGNTRSVGVQPIQGAWRSGANILLQLPGLFTNIMPATVIPRNTSSAT